MKRLFPLVALVMAMAVLAPAAFADDDPTEVEVVDMEEKDPSAAQLWKAEMIADYVAPDGTTAEEILALRTGSPAFGWGVLFAVQAYAVAGMDLDEFMTDDGGYALGQIRKAYLEGLEEGGYLPLEYKNFGQLQKETKEKPEKATPPGQLQKETKEKPEKPEKATPPGQLKKEAKTEG